VSGPHKPTNLTGKPMDAVLVELKASPAKKGAAAAGGASRPRRLLPGIGKQLPRGIVLEWGEELGLHRAPQQSGSVQ